MATYYVSTSGDNGNSGLDTDHPWATLEYAESHATTAGDIIALKKGNTWTMDDAFEINTGGAGGTYITWDGAIWGSGANAIISSGNQVHWNCLLHIAACDYLKVQNITFEGNDHNVSGIVIGSDHNSFGPTQQSNEDHIIINNCTVQNFGNGTQYLIGILVQAFLTNMSDITVQYCTVNGIGSHGIAFYVYTDANLSVSNININNNYVTNFGETAGVANGIFLNNRIIGGMIEHNTVVQGATEVIGGISISRNSSSNTLIPTGITVRYNEVRMTDHPALYIDAGGACSVDIYYNIFYVSSIVTYRDAAFIFSQDMSWNSAVFNFWNNVVICGGNLATSNVFGYYYSGGTMVSRNNILVSLGTNTGGDYCFKTDQSITHSNNLYHRTLTGNQGYIDNNGSVILRDDVDSYEVTSVVGDPVFTTNYTNLHLQVTSPCIDTGTDVGLDEDLDGNVVPFNSIVDMGAYEYGSGPGEGVHIENPFVHSIHVNS